jgi:hypothetical protein
MCHGVLGGEPGGSVVNGGSDGLRLVVEIHLPVGVQPVEFFAPGNWL